MLNGRDRQFLKRYLPLLRVLNELGPINLEAVLPHLKDNVHGVLQECCYNCVRNPQLFNGRTRSILKRKLQPFKKTLLAGVCTNSKKKRKRQTISRQRGKGVGVATASVLAAAVPLLLEFLK